jgi:hypothetical protein
VSDKINKFKLLRKKINFSTKRLLVFALIFGAVGGFIIYRSFASGFVASADPENSTITSPATVGTDTSASGGKYLQYGP